MFYCSSDRDRDKDSDEDRDMHCTLIIVILYLSNINAFVVHSVSSHSASARHVTKFPSDRQRKRQST
jgi:hypothetical protein